MCELSCIGFSLASYVAYVHLFVRVCTSFSSLCFALDVCVHAILVVHDTHWSCSTLLLHAYNFTILRTRKKSPPENKDTHACIHSKYHAPPSGHTPTSPFTICRSLHCYKPMQLIQSIHQHRATVEHRWLRPTHRLVRTRLPTPTSQGIRTRR